MGFGLGLGGLFGGIMYNRKGAAETFAGAFLVVLGGWMLCTAAQQIVRCLARWREDEDDLKEPLL